MNTRIPTIPMPSLDDKCLLASDMRHRIGCKHGNHHLSPKCISLVPILCYLNTYQNQQNISKLKQMLVKSAVRPVLPYIACVIVVAKKIKSLF